jgi:hypothetical protein
MTFSPLRENLELCTIAGARFPLAAMVAAV